MSCALTTSRFGVLLCRLASYMESAHEFFAESFEGVFATEAEAEQFALASQQRLWALVVVRLSSACLLPSPLHAGWVVTPRAAFPRVDTDLRPDCQLVATR